LTQTSKITIIIDTFKILQEEIMAKSDIAILMLPGPFNGELEPVEVWHSKLTRKHLMTCYERVRGIHNIAKFSPITSNIEVLPPAFDSLEINNRISEQIDDCKLVLEGNIGQEIYKEIIKPLNLLKDVFDKLQFCQADTAKEKLEEMFFAIMAGASSIANKYNSTEQLALNEMRKVSSLNSALLHGQDQLIEKVYIAWGQYVEDLVNSYKSLNTYRLELRKKVDEVSSSYKKLDYYFKDDNPTIIAFKNFFSDFNIRIFQFTAGFNESTCPSDGDITKAKKLLDETKSKMEYVKKTWAICVNNILSWFKDNQSKVTNLIEIFNANIKNIHTRDKEFDHGEKIPTLLVEYGLITEEQRDIAYKILERDDFSPLQFEVEIKDLLNTYGAWVRVDMSVSSSINSYIDQGCSHLEQLQHFLGKEDEHPSEHVYNYVDEDADFSEEDKIVKIYDAITAISWVIVTRHGNHILNSSRELLSLIQTGVYLKILNPESVSLLKELEDFMSNKSKEVTDSEISEGLSCLTSNTDVSWIKFSAVKGNGSKKIVYWRVTKAVATDAEVLQKKYNLDFKKVSEAYKMCKNLSTKRLGDNNQ
jgi:hypothetical protein